jgi:hypothetical protein
VISLLFALAFSNMPPPPIDICPRVDAGTVCLTPRRTSGVCVKGTCSRFESTKDGYRRVTVDCQKCEAPVTDGGTR